MGYYVVIIFIVKFKFKSINYIEDGRKLVFKKKNSSKFLIKL